MNRFNAAMGRWKKDQDGNWKRITDPLNTCASLDEPIFSAKDGGEIDTLGGTIEDSKQADQMERAEEAIYTRQLHDALKKSLATLEQQERDIVVMRFQQQKTRRQCVDALYLRESDVRKLEGKGLRHLRSPQSLKYIQRFHDDIIDRFAWYGLGFGAWESAGASGVERAVERAEQKTQQKVEYWFRA
jgi:DNA-directed RNA polymerase specialized sigma subunit